ncbi:MAG: choice-of-anchor J domain-containing protein, partial [Spirochaetales bacterium]|nr:choice-of-anchor J domain-containing protein [Spirochaetales bacterium]
QAFTLDFESSADYSSDFTPWSVLDNDGLSTYGSSDSDFPGEESAFAFMAFNPSDAGFSLASPHGGQRCGMAICPSDGSASDNWLISPQLNLGFNSSISFWALSPKPGSWGNDEFKVAVSTTNNSPASFTTISGSSAIQAPDTWTEFSYDLSAYDNQEIYIAIQHVSVDMFMFWIDDISITTSLVGKDEVFSANVRIYPNPADNYVMADLGNLEPEQSQITVYGLMGEVVKSVVPGESTNVKIDLSDLPSGMYIIRIDSPQGSFIEKISLTK